MSVKPLVDSIPTTTLAAKVQSQTEIRLSDLRNHKKQLQLELRMVIEEERFNMIGLEFCYQNGLLDRPTVKLHGGGL